MPGLPIAELGYNDHTYSFTVSYAAAPKVSTLADNSGI